MKTEKRIREELTFYDVLSEHTPRCESMSDVLEEISNLLTFECFSEIPKSEMKKIIDDFIIPQAGSEEDVSNLGTIVGYVFDGFWANK